MGCGASNEAQPVAVVPSAAQPVDPTKPHKVQVAGILPAAGANGAAPPPGGPNGASNQLPPGLASFKNSPQAAGLGSRRGDVSGGEGDLPPVRNGSKVFSNGGPIVVDNAPPGSQIPGLNYCTPEFFPTHMEQCWNHYARPPDYKLIDKSGLKIMAEDAVMSFMDAARKAIIKDNPRWNEQKIETKLNSLRSQFLPGSTLADSIVIATHFLAHELKFQAGEDSKSSGVTKPCFFLHFQRAHRTLFSYTYNAEITLERELLVQKLNKQGVERANKGLKSLTANKSASDKSGLSSSRGVRSVKASSRHKSKKGASTAKGKSDNMFGELDFSGPAAPTPSIDE